MIEMLKGVCRARTSQGIIVDVNGVGYGVDMPLSSLLAVGAVGSDVLVWIHTHVREDVIRLFGFLTYEEKQAFLMLMSVSGVGPKVALAILSSLDPRMLQHAISHNQPKIFEQVSGVGRKLAERLVLELKSKIDKLNVIAAAMPAGMGADRVGASRIDISEPLFGENVDLGAVPTLIADVRSALNHLGFKDREIDPLVPQLRQSQGDFADVMRQALVTLKGPKALGREALG